MQSDETTNQLLQCLIHVVGRAAMPLDVVQDIVGTGKKQIKAFNLCVFPEIVEEKVKQVSLDGLTDNEKEAVGAFQRALKRRREGKGDDDWGRDSEED